MRDSRHLGPPLEAHRFDEKALTDYLSAKIAGFDPNIRVSQFRGGQSNPTFLLESDSASYVLRKKPPGKLLPSAHAVDREFRVISALAGSAVPVPEVQVLCEDDAVIGQMFYVMEYIPGRVFENGSLPDCTPEDRSCMYHSMASVFGAMHCIDYKAVGLELFGKPMAYVSRQVSRWSKQYYASKVEEDAAMDRLIEWLPEHNPEDEQASIVHGDFRPGNVIFHNERPEVSAVLDWELSTIGHPLADLGYFLMPYYLDAEFSSNGIGDLTSQRSAFPRKPSCWKPMLPVPVGKASRTSDSTWYFPCFDWPPFLQGCLNEGWMAMQPIPVPLSVAGCTAVSRKVPGQSHRKFRPAASNLNFLDLPCITP